jgi:hypothetical protein
MPAHRGGAIESSVLDRLAPDARTPDGRTPDGRTTDARPHSQVVHRCERWDSRLGCNQLLQLLSSGGSNLRAGCL